MEPFQIRNKYYARFTFLGKQYRFSLKTSNKKVAQEVADQIQRGLERGLFDSFEQGSEGLMVFQTLVARPGLRAEEVLEEIHAGSKRKELRQAIDEYLENCQTEHSPNNYRNEVRVFKNFIAQVNVSFVHQVTAEMIEKWRNGRIELVSKSTINRELKMLKRFFRQAVQKGYLAKNSAETVKTYREPEIAIRHLSDDEIRSILNVAPQDLRNIITFLLLTGLRYGELCYLEWPDIDFRHKQVVIQPKEGWKPKNFKKRIVPMHPTAEEILKSLPRHDDISLIFPDRDGKCAYKGLRNRLYLVFKRAKVNGNVKDLRSTFASNAAMSGLPIYTVSKLLGHHDVKITEKHYAHLAPDYMGNAITMIQTRWDQKEKVVNSGSLLPR